MKKILVPTDFSDTAMLAADVASQLSEKILAETHFLTCISSPQTPWESLGEKGWRDLQEVRGAQKHYADLAKRHSAARMRQVMAYSFGDLVPAMVRYVDREDVYMIVMGSSGAEGVRELLVGSNAQKIVKTLSCPVMVVKQRDKSQRFQKIVFASDFRREALAPFRHLVELADSLGAHIQLLQVKAEDAAVYEKALAKPVVEEFERAAMRVSHSFHEFADVTVELGIKHFVEDRQADMVAIVHDGRFDKRGLFTSSLTYSLVNHFEVPVLTYNTQDVNGYLAFSEAELTEVS
jgi:nucleotide-binding universal stress UspA family protein